ncbi:DUF1311 domain-containing protein [Vibrio cholerae]|uniref:lysozyme inhibitor LprI family protein n=1 Tax=Vibrio cholerae TaxID=666 RepID=UPI0029AF0974|nr:DUF1311 domain-containing protein [Vibrio cholerae]ELU9851486.1 DUF1311 domain-containing protein [Vibrio cholerae]ELV3249731.1 DUF1311 domain-containing protein [Vibrio cholerae]ELV3250301.1 DUF1311 domain-containing protein [Vibrio cholerae]
MFIFKFTRITTPFSCIEIWLFLNSMLFIPLASAQSEPAFTPDATNQCLANVYQSSTSLSSHSVLDCVGLSANYCIASSGGDTTIGMMSCLQRELEFWEVRLNSAYTERMRNAINEDIDMSSYQIYSVSNSLRLMQEAWFSYRDAACFYEQALWLGGSGSIPATMACQMHETARQALKLEGWWPQ